MSKRQTDSMDIRGKEKTFADAFYTSTAWKKCARGYRRSVGDLCERCRKKGLIVPAEEVHHKIHLTPENINRPEIALNWRNLIALCKDCHMNEHRKQKRWTVDEDGNVSPRDPP
jgi:5-methylcytosine-specific restriction endonuclease McrA